MRLNFELITTEQGARIQDELLEIAERLKELREQPGIPPRIELFLAQS